MKKHKYFFSVLFLTFGMSPIISGQTYKNYDSISIFQPKMNKNRFEVNTEHIKSLRIKNRKSKRATYPASEVLEDIGRVGLTLIVDAFWGSLGIETETAIGDTDEVNWVVNSEINCNIPNLNWKIQIFTEGIHHKEFYASNGFIGSDGQKEIWMDDNTYGIILHQKDTIGRFILLRNPDIDEVIEKIAPNDFEDKKFEIMSGLKSTFEQGNLFLWHMDYGIIGKFRGKDFAMVGSDQAHKAYIFQDGLVIGILQDPVKNTYPQSKKSKEIELLMDKKIIEHSKNDMLRLAMLHFYMNSHIL